MTDDEKYYDIPWDNDNVPYVTIKQMQELRPDTKLHVDGQTGLCYTDFFSKGSRDLLNAHLLVELLMEDPDKVDWAKVTYGFDKRIIEYLEHIFQHPLVWVNELPDELQKDIVVVGKIAQEKSSYERDCCMPYDKFFFNMFYHDRLLWFADNLPTGKDFGDFGIYYNDFILWNYLIEGIGTFRLQENEHLDVYNISDFIWNINYIAEQRGGVKAAEIIRKFRDDWQDIVAQKLFYTQRLSDQQKESFRLALFEGMERNLRKWEAESDQQTPQQKPTSFPLLTDQCRAENKTQLVEAELRAACQGTAVGLWKTIRTNEALGYLFADRLSTAKVYRAFTDYFGALPYTERNFRDARDRA